MRCVICGETEKSKFYSSLGCRYKCKKCHNKYQKQNYYLKREKKLAYQYEYNKTEKAKQTSKRIALLWKKKYPKRFSIYQKVYKNIKSGKLIKPKECCFCKTNKRIVAHHEDYNKPLEVKWMCDRCHRNYHIKLNIN